MSTIAFRGQGKTAGDICNKYPTVFEHGFVGWGVADFELFLGTSGDFVC